jgi:large subunit ribosomal protein L22
MAVTRTNERPGTRAQVRHVRMSASKAREVLDLIRGLPVGEAAGVLRFTERGAADVVDRCLGSAVANAQHNDELDPDMLYVSTCYADEGPTLKRWRPRARGRATRIRKRMCHITIIVSPMPAEMAAKVEARQAAGGAVTPAGRRSRRAQESRRARVARSRGEAVTEAPEDETPDTPIDEVEPTTGEPTDEMVEEAEDEAELTDDESPSDDESTDERGVDSAGGGDAEGGASTEADSDVADEAADDTTDEAPADDADEEKK